MKIKIFTISLIILCNNAFSQKKLITGAPAKIVRDTISGKSFCFNSPALLIRIEKRFQDNAQTQSDLTEIIKNGTAIVSRANENFTVESLAGDSTHYILRLWVYIDKKIKNRDPQVLKNIHHYYGNENTNQPNDPKSLDMESELNTMKIDSGNMTREKYIFLISIDQFNKNCGPFIKNTIRWGFGTMTYPFRWRTQTGVIEQSANIGLIFGYSHKFKGSSDWSYGFYGGASETSNTLDSATTKGMERKTTTVATLTPSLNFILSWKTLQITIGRGWDFLVGEQSNIARNWIYKNKGWIGFGIGVSIFNTSAPSNANGTQTPSIPPKNNTVTLSH